MSKTAPVPLIVPAPELLPEDLAAVLADLRRHEGFRDRPYRCTAGKLTIGFGRNLDDVGLRKHEAEVLLRSDVADVVTALDRAHPWWRTMPEGPRRALVNMAFQLGMTRLSQFRNMLAALERGDWPEARRQALDSRWARQTPNRAAEVADMIHSNR
jgi:lysozyme